MQMQSTAAPRQPELHCGAYHEDDDDEKQDEIGDRDSDSPLQWTILSLFYLSPHVQFPVHHIASTYCIIK